MADSKKIKLGYKILSGENLYNVIVEKNNVIVKFDDGSEGILPTLQLIGILSNYKFRQVEGQTRIKPVAVFQENDGIYFDLGTGGEFNERG